MKYPIVIQTPYGIKFYHVIQSKFDFCKRNDLASWFQAYESVNGVKEEKALIQWLETHPMESSDEMRYWKEKSDEIAIRNYFIKRNV